MNTQHFSAILLISGFAALLLSVLLGPQGVYETPNPYRRIQIIDEYKTRWNISQPLTGLSILLTAAGFAVLALHLRTMVNTWLPVLGAAAFAVGTISTIVFLYFQIMDPLSTFQGAYSSMETLYYWLALGGLLLFGIAFLQAGLPAWLGYIAAGVAIVYGIVFLISGAGYLTPFLVALLSLVIAIFLLRQ